MSHAAQPASALLKTRRFLPLFITQFLGALNDNLFKNALIILILTRFAEDQALLVPLAGGIFILPYALFSTIAGQLSDRFDKAVLIRRTKLVEVGLMALAGAGFYFGSLPLLLAVLFGLGAQSTFFGPMKYGILPDHLRDHELVSGNGLIEAGTFLAILAGTIAGADLIGRDNGALLVTVGGLIFALIGYVAALQVPPAPSRSDAFRISLNVPADTGRLIRLARHNLPVWLAILGISWFWLMGSVVLAAFPGIAAESLKADNSVITLMLTVFAVGVGVGSVACAKLLHGRIALWPVALGGVGLSLFLADFALSAAGSPALPTVSALLGSLSGLRMMADLALLALCGGLFSVPLYAIMQERSDPAVRSRMIAVNNILNALFMVAGALAMMGLAKAGVSQTSQLLVAAALNLPALLYGALRSGPEALKALLRGYFRLFHRAEIIGRDNAEKVGERSVILVNHQSFLDGLFVAAHLPGMPVFAVDTDQARRFWYLKYFVKFFAVDPANPMSTKAMIRTVREGRQLVIFPEGRITLTGSLMKIYDGTGTIADKADADILPVRIDGLQFHKFSRLKGLVPQRWFPRFRMIVLPPRRLSADPELRGKKRREQLTRQIHDIMMEAAFRPETLTRTLLEELLEARTKYDVGQVIAADPMKVELTYSRLLLGACVLGRVLRPLTSEGEKVGLLLPTSAGVTVSFFALQAFRRIPAMLNFSAGADNILSACKAAEIRTILTSRVFIEKARLGGLIDTLSRHVRIVWLDDVRAGLTLSDKLAGKFLSLRPHRLPGARGTAHEPAVVLFTSGSEGAPKGVVLSHANLLANCGQVAAVADLNPRDRIFNALPTFHSFGLTGGVILPLMLGIRTYLYPSPLHYKLVPELAYLEQSTVLFGTDSFLAGYARMGRPLDFQSMRFIVAGAEKFKEETRRTYWEKFQKPVYEGYGVTECSPVAAVNTPAWYRPGTVGRLLPHVEHRLEPVPGIETGGRLILRAPNIMLGYLKADAPGQLQPPPDGWYDTGDIVSLDAEGFVTIQGRAKRFAKIAGEMVSLTAAEALAADLWPASAHAVVSLPDPRKGEQLLLITTQSGAAVSDLQAHARKRGVAEIMVPRQIRQIDRLPLLGTGKTDYPALQKLVTEPAAG